jgi:hypothetical protein
MLHALKWISGNIPERRFNLIQFGTSQNIRLSNKISSHHHNIKFLLIICFEFLLFFALCINNLVAQAELTPWGSITGFRIEGHLIKFNTSICLIDSSMAGASFTNGDNQRRIYSRKGDNQFISSVLSKFEYKEMVQDTGRNMAKLNIKVKAADSILIGIFLYIELPSEEYTGAKIELLDSAASAIEPVSLFPGRAGMPGPPRFGNLLMQALVKGFRVITADKKLEVTTAQPIEIIIQKANPRFGNLSDRIFLGIMNSHIKKGDQAEKTFLFRVSGEVDRTPVHISFDPGRPGRKFFGIGGNFRIQNDELDTMVIDYCLNNLDVRWARIELPWRSWHPVENIDPLEAVSKNRIDENVRLAMELAQKLYQRHIPIILSAWSPPEWAIQGQFNFRNENGVFGNPLNPKKMRSIVKSLTDYLIYLKEAYGVEADLFSFNESDLGINVRMTGQEHADFIKRFGEYLASKNLTTKMLLGDNSDANTIDFIEPALKDPGTHKYIGAISFHSWRGCDNWTLSNWKDASKELNVSLIVAEGGIDAQAYMSPDIFREPSFAQEEVDVYARACNVADVSSILQWQLTSDYSLLTGRGIYNTEGDLHPTQRFWNLKQFGLIPPGSFILPAKCDQDEISCAAFGDISDNTYVIHIVNNGASRIANLDGFPDSIKVLRVFVTDNLRGMEEIKHVRVSEGKAKLTLEPFAFITVITGG